MTLTNDIVQQIERLPEPLQKEVIDFVEFLQSKHCVMPDQSSADSLLQLKGGLESSMTFIGDDVEIQEKLRDEWQ
ncbi:MAG: DUF2281 domain-containing protein [Halomonas sp.]|uniref:DUF2281 domain-containing protein n=1 Tax=Halomonas sp. TaxID=1486246 RepID=UPI002ACD4140|nr:DUF2281 domain-containing protein [Halomonas sp.]MDZ7852549.1 DUF2281 domain-containing protein [Halomonas sp.]